MTNTKTITYLGYCRKSSESDERQVQSIEDQTTVVKGLSTTFGLKLKDEDIIEDSRTARLPYRRDGFKTLVARIQSGEAQGIICWKLDRLARNPEEAGIIMGMLQRGEIKHIKTFEKDFRPEDNALLTFVEFGIANQYSRDLSSNVKRGLKSKLEKGIRPGGCPPGYLNTKTKNRGENDVIVDDERFDDIKKAWDMLLTNNLTPMQILNWLNNERGYQTLKTKKRGGGPMSRTSMYSVFNNIFYAGWFHYGGGFHKGTHTSMITLEEFDRAQILLGKRGKPRNQPQQYAYTGAIMCEACGNGVIATYKKKLIKKDGKVHEYTLYFCERCRKAKTSAGRRYANVNLIEEAIEQELAQLEIAPEFLEWALDIIDETEDEAHADKKHVAESLQKAADACQTRLERLLEGYSRGVIDDEDFLQQKNLIKNEAARLHERLGTLAEADAEWLQLTRKSFEFAAYAHKAFLLGDTKTRREILLGLADLNCTLSGRIINIKAMEWFIPLQEFDSPLMAEFEALEPEVRRTSRTDERFEPLALLLRGRRDLNPRSLP
jgi:site-specific DNA recombinase